MVKRYVVFIFLAVFLVAHQASATLPRQLPTSSHYDGFAFYDEEWEDWFDLLGYTIDSWLTIDQRNTLLNSEVYNNDSE